VLGVIDAAGSSKRKVTSRFLKDAWAEFHDIPARTVREKIFDKQCVDTSSFDVARNARAQCEYMRVKRTEETCCLCMQS